MAGSRTQAVLFDIDGTLISTGGASDRAWKRAFKELQDVDVDVPAVTGKGVPDPEVGRVVFEKAIGREPTEEEAEALMRRRLDHLPEEVENSPGFVVKDGVVELLEKLSGGRDPARPHHRQRRGGRPHQAGQRRPQPLLLLRRLRLGFARPHRAHREGAGAGEGALWRRLRSRQLLLLRRHAARRGGRPRRGHPGRGRRHRRVHGRGAGRGRRRRGGPFARRRPSAALVGRAGSRCPRWLIRHITDQPPLARAP